MNDLRNELVRVLGTESTTGWMDLMEIIQNELESVLKRGKPSAAAIADSIIGQNGFSSWKEMVETPVTENGLGWNIHAWNSYKRAWSTIKKYPYLRDLELTASMVNTLTRELKGVFPETLEEFEAHSEARIEVLKESHKNSLSQAQKHSQALSEALRESKTTNEAQDKEIIHLKEHNAALIASNSSHSEQVGMLKSQKEQIEIRLTELKSKISEKDNEIESLQKKVKSLSVAKSSLERKTSSLENQGFVGHIKSAFQSIKPLKRRLDSE